jgi:hypothetical protein
VRSDGFPDLDSERLVNHPGANQVLGCPMSLKDDV